MIAINRIVLPFIVLLLASCVTINVYFPAAAAEEAADRIIDHVLGEDAKDKQSEEVKPSKDSSYYQRLPAQILVGMLDWVVSPAHAAADIDVSSPAINDLKASMQSRHGKLSAHYKSGAIGYTSEGLVAVRDASAVGLRERGKLKQMVAQENRDRNALYREIAHANGHPEWESQIRGTFSKRWIARAPAGWYYQSRSGQWIQK